MSIWGGIKSWWSDVTGIKDRNKAESLINKQISELGGRQEGLQDFFSELRGISEDTYQRNRGGLFDMFLQESMDIKNQENAFSKTGLRSGQADYTLDTQRDFLRSGTERKLADLFSNRQAELLGLGQQETDALQALQDQIFALKTEKLNY